MNRGTNTSTMGSSSTPTGWIWPASRRSGARGGPEDLAGRHDHAVLAFGFDLAALELLLVEPRVQTALAKKLRVRPLLDDATTVQHKDDVGRQDGGQTVRDSERGASAHQGTKSLLHQSLAGGV